MSGSERKNQQENDKNGSKYGQSQVRLWAESGYSVCRHRINTRSVN